MPQKTALYEQHRAAGAKLVDFAGWDMPLHYGSQLDEHHQVRHDAGVFDVSHMVVVDLQGADAKAYLRHLLANDVARLTEPGKAIYSCMLKPDAGVIDDLIVYYLSDTSYRVVVNAGTRDKDLAWMNEQAKSYQVELSERADLAMLAVQGPQAREKARAALGEALDPAMALKPFYACQCEDLFVARTGYTGEDGFEIILTNEGAPEAWQALLAAGVAPAGLGARDTLRLEAGMNLYGQDMDETTSPLVSGLTWTVAFDPVGRDFIGRQALERQRSMGVSQKLVGLVLEGRGVLRHGQKVVTEAGDEGVITSGGFSPTLNCSIALARVPQSMAEHCLVEIRNKQLPARVVKPPFVRFGKSCLK